MEIISGLYTVSIAYKIGVIASTNTITIHITTTSFTQGTTVVTAFVLDSTLRIRTTTQIASRPTSLTTTRKRTEGVNRNIRSIIPTHHRRSITTLRVSRRSTMITYRATDNKKFTGTRSRVIIPVNRTVSVITTTIKTALLQAHTAHPHQHKDHQIRQPSPMQTNLLQALCHS